MTHAITKGTGKLAINTACKTDEVLVVSKGTAPLTISHEQYVKLINGSSVSSQKGTICLSTSMIPPPPKDPVAAGQEATVTGDPHVKEADGGKFDFQGEPGKVYNLLNDQGLIVNAKFQPWKGQQNATTMGEIAVMVSGNQGTSIIQINAHNQPHLTLNGQHVQPGEFLTLADGGTLSLSNDGRMIDIVSKEGYHQRIRVQGNGSEAYLDYSVRSSAKGVAADGKLPGGLVGHTFDADTILKNGKTGKGAQGEGAIDGVYTDYEVPNGLLGMPQPQVMRSQAMACPTVTSSDYQANFGIPIGTNPALMPSETIQDLWQATLQQPDTFGQSRDAKTRKLQLLLQLALASGNIDLAMLLMSGLETRQCNEVAAGLMNQIQDLQSQRKAYAEEMGKLGKNGDPSKFQEFNIKAGDIGTEISLLQTFLQDVMAQKNESQAMASNFLKAKHETSMGIIRNMA